ncbi:hypothetical protein AN8238.2 [Aspergillus nidulans FGSC A4]|uniref:CN hydrolase domain-containing protein n=1 Tax=Emericella nidulans (strain FGSC A4 / ATCC 38163 / CBS 112.46 / NRRL 194 / M139) TaxID=227321 RepID=Q5ATZ2_EMENI|nr:hypothetical protein [Aspergillus nidulans FGSC A4]EAA58976.1 hypothetical protein AN8238.2 [Aspergillus nidulans FGSC A4]CBF74180.1 TPA: conserved hypothetical protein [Aspergillus nidulans FGSC A4]|eukprot:XP_681507.1 hypothetical protein AN8238.2 [Aspergillus nidulans FGSC A4]
MAQTLIDPEGEVLIHNYKLRPSGQQRIFGVMVMDELKVVETPFGRVGLLECWEHFHPSMTFLKRAHAEAMHIGHSHACLTMEEQEQALGGRRGENAGCLFVGRAAAFYPSGLETAQISANASYTKHPYLLVSVNTTGFATIQPSVQREQSWAVLEQIWIGGLEDVPKVIGEFTKPVMNSVNDF